MLVDHDFGEPPVAGTLRIIPGSGTVGWGYRVDPIPPETTDRAGDLDASVAVPYRFESPGVHLIRVELIGPEGPVIVEKAIVVLDPESDFEVLAQRPVDEIWPDAEDVSPEGIVMDPAGRWLYAADYRSGELVRIDPTTFEVVDRLSLRPLVEGLTVIPAGDRLVAIHKNAGLSVVDLGSFTATHSDGFGGHFIQTVDESHVLIGGFGLERVEVDSRATERAPLSRGGGHFSVFPDGNRVVSVEHPLVGGPSLEVLSLPGLDPILSIPLEELSLPWLVAVDPSGERIYAFGWGGTSVRFLVVNSATGEVIRSMSVDQGSCVGYCVANPVVTFASGRYVAFELGGTVSVVDTSLDHPRYRFDPGSLAFGGPSGVAAHPESDILYVLGGNTPTWRLYKIRLRNP